MNISSAIFDCSSPDLASCPDESLPEFAFIGRSNVGKSSLLNMLAGRDGLARVSPVPGHTKLINMFTMNRNWRLVDLPGYGFAAGAKHAKARFNKAVSEYLEHRPNLCLVFALIDSGLEPQEIDVEFVGWLARNSVPFVLVFTKTDKLSATQVQVNIAAFMARLTQWFSQPPAIFTCSSTTNAGKEALLGAIEESMTAIQTEAAEAPVSSDDEPTPSPKPSARPKKRPDRQRPW